jgi:hypothetical protein
VKKKQKIGVKKAYCCGIAWQHEMGETNTILYSTAKQCKQRCNCTNDCGIVEVEIRLKRWVVKQKPINKWRSSDRIYPKSIPPKQKID